MVSQSRTFTGTLWASPAPGPTARRAFKVYVRNVRDFRTGSTCWMTKTQVKSRDSHEETTARAHPSTKQSLALFTCLPSPDANAHVVNGRTRRRAPNPLMPEGSLCKPGLPTQHEGDGWVLPVCNRGEPQAGLQSGHCLRGPGRIPGASGTAQICGSIRSWGASEIANSQSYTARAVAQWEAMSSYHH